MKPITVLLVDDHPIVRDGTRTALERDTSIAVVGTVTRGTDALVAADRLRPAVVLLDVHLPDMSGVEVARRLRETLPEAAILVLTGYAEMGYARALLSVGIQGYLSKTATGPEIAAAVRAVAAGRRVLTAEAAVAARGSAEIALTPRERQVLVLWAAGRRYAEIADELCISVKTVEVHVGHLLDKLGATSRAEALDRVRDLGLLLR